MKVSKTETRMEYISEQTFEAEDYSKKPLAKGEYEFCLFRNCNFSDSELTEIRFIETEFVDCNLSNARIHKTAFQDVTFNNCKMLGLQFDTCNDFGFAVSFENSQLNDSIFYKMKLRGTSFKGCQLQGVDFTEAEMENTILQNCDLRNAVFDHTNLENADLRNATNYSIDPEANRLKGARFSLPEVLGLLEKYKIKIDKL